MKKLLKVLLSLVVLLVLLGTGGFLWAGGKADDVLARNFDVHNVDFPIPFPLDSAEIAEAGLTPEQADSAALARAVERGRHAVESRYACSGCHGPDFGGGVMVDSKVLATLYGPNLTTGQGSRTVAYTAADWDRIVRHGVLPNGTPSAMPAQDFKYIPDQDLSDIVAYIRSLPPVDRETPPRALGPLGTVLIATGQLPLSPDLIGAHDQAHDVRPPAEEVSAEFGRHMAVVCMGCHGDDLAGGKQPGGDPAWPAAGNLTSHPDGAGSWTLEQFRAFMREGVRPDGTRAGPPMAEMVAYTNRMTDTEVEALWTYLRSIPQVEGN